MPGCREVSRTLGRTPGHAGDMAQVRGSAAECSQGPGQSAGTPGPASPGLRPMDHGRCTQAPGPLAHGPGPTGPGPRAMDDGPRITNVSVAPKVWQRSGPGAGDTLAASLAERRNGPVPGEPPRRERSYG